MWLLTELSVVVDRGVCVVVEEMSVVVDRGVSVIVDRDVCGC